MAIIVPGILTNDEEDYAKRLHMAEHVAGLVQIDVVDGKFAKSSTVGVDVISKYPSSCSLEIQLMVLEPFGYIVQLAPLPFVSKIIFPLEINADIADCLYAISKSKKQAGISLNPETEIATSLPHFEKLDLLLLMTGRPGYSGQKLGSETYERIRTAKRLNKSLPVEVDIGVNFENAAKLASAGADFLVSSSALFNEPDFRVAFEKMSGLAR